MKKRLNIDGISNELKGGSAFFPDYKNQPEVTPLPEVETVEQRNQQTNIPVLPVRDVRPVLPVPSVKRVMKQRWPSDIWQDQYQTLQELSLEDRKAGLSGSMSAMVREALDNYIAKRRSK
jgi:hypothetical protein